MRRSLAVALLVLAVAGAFAGAAALLAPPAVDLDARSPDETDLIRVEGAESGIHPYIGPRKAFPGKSPVNLLVEGNLSRVQAALVDRSGESWGRDGGERREDAHPEEIGDELGLPERIWGPAHGSVRYAYVHDGERGRWVDADAQIQDGSYFGERVHVRLYESPDPDEPWVGMQAHTEYFDWFTLRHEVTGVAEARRQVEADFMGQPGVERVYRSWEDNGGAYDHDGWVTVVQLAAVPPLVLGLAARGSRRGAGSRPGGGSPGGGLRARAADRLLGHLAPADRRRIRAAARRVTPHHWALAGVVVGIVLGVRAAGLLLERYAGFLDVYVVAGLLYPVVGVGLPAGAYLAARGLDRRVDAGVTAAVAMGVAVLADFAILGAKALPLDVVLQRVGVVAAVGLVAAGGALRARRDRRVNDLVAAGAILWVGVLVAALLGWL